MGCSWLRPPLALGANTDIHTEPSGLCCRAMGLGAMPGRPTSRFSLSGAGILPAPSREKQRHSGADLEGHPPSLLWCPPQRYSLPCTTEKASLPPFPDHSPAEVSEVIPACTRTSLRAAPTPHGMQYCICLYLCLSRPVCVCACGGAGGLSFLQVIQDVHDPKRGLDSWARRLRVFEGKRCPRSPVCVQEPS